LPFVAGGSPIIKKGHYEDEINDEKVVTWLGVQVTEQSETLDIYTVDSSPSKP
jgi:hypothetical protein